MARHRYSLLTLPLLAAVLWAAPPGKPAIKYGSDTTRTSKSIRPDGTIDYVAIINGANKLPSAATNSAVNWFEALGPDSFTDEARKIAPAALGVKFEDKAPSYIRHPFDVDKSADFDPDYFKALEDGIDSWSINPWNAKEQQLFERWLTRNEPALKKIAEAARKARWTIPLVHIAETSSLEEDIAASLGRKEAYETAGRIFLVRANLRRFEGNLDAAWSDIETAHRLGALMTQGATLRERTLGMAIVQKVQRTLQNVAFQVAMSDTLYRAWAEKYAALPQPASPLTAMDQAQRFITLDTALRWATDPPRMLKWIDEQDADAGFKAEARRRVESGELATVDWTAVLRKINEHYDGLVSAAHGKRFADRYRATMQVIARREQAVKELPLLTGPELATRWMTAVLMATIDPQADRALTRYEIAGMEQQMTLAALSLGGFSKKNGYWPERLDLARNPRLRLNPVDLFTDKPLIFHLNPDGWALYSVGENGRDDLGHNPTQGEDYKGDDIVVRLGLADPPKPAVGK